METLIQRLILAHAQFVARHYLALRCSGDKLVELVRHSIGADAPGADEILLFLRREDTQRILESEHETALWISCDHHKTWRLICLAVTNDIERARKRINKRPPPESCSFCWQSDPVDQLVAEKNLYNEPSGALLHKQCLRSWQLLRNLTERAQ